MKGFLDSYLFFFTRLCIAALCFENRRLKRLMFKEKDKNVAVGVPNPDLSGFQTTRLRPVVRQCPKCVLLRNARPFYINQSFSY